MSGDEREVSADRGLIARRWLAVADLDIRSVRACMGAHEPIPEIAAYHCQQAAEKLFKCLLVLAEVPLQKTHDLEALRDPVIMRFPDFTTTVDRLVPLADWSHIYRYPQMGDEPVPSLEELQSALGEIERLARAVALHIEAGLPPA